VLGLATEQQPADGGLSRHRCDHGLIGITETFVDIRNVGGTGSRVESDPRWVVADGELAGELG
jgi:hypothetical protein